jgi:selenocysteine lyase/cysteine desulfurase
MSAGETFAHDFGPFGDRVWLNCAHQGALPRVAAEEAREAVAWKVQPYLLTAERFRDVPARLRRALGRLIGVPAEEIVLGNSASYGLHLLANGIPWRTGDEILLVRGDFPSAVLPWLALQRRGVRVRQVEPRRHLLGPEELRASLTPATRLFCTTWVHSFSGWAADLPALGAICREHGVTFVVNASQALGARPLDVSAVPVDALVSVGFKWLCGPYGTGFCWLRPPLVQSLEYNQAYWLSALTAADLAREDDLARLPEGPKTARTYDVFGTANFFNFKPWAASVEYLLGQGVERVAAHDQRLVTRLIDGLERRKYDLLSPAAGLERSTLVFLSHKDPGRNAAVYEQLGDRGIGVAFRRGRVRLAPHLYNTDDDIDRALAALNDL